MTRRRSAWGLGLGVLLLAATAGAGSLKGTVVPAKGGTTEPTTEYFQGFWPRQALSVRATSYDPRPFIIVVAEGIEELGARASLELQGERLWPPVIAVTAGGDFELHNNGRKQKNFTTVGSDVMKNVLIPRGGTLNAKFPAPGVFPIVVAGSPHIKAVVVVTPAKQFARLDRDGSFKFDNLADGSQVRLKLFYRDGWLNLKPVELEIKGNTEAPAIQLDGEMETEGSAAAPPAPAPAPAPSAPAAPAPAQEK